MHQAAREVTIKLMEELGEAVQAGAKVANYGFVACCVGKVWDNQGKLERECGDVLAMMAVCLANGVVTRDKLRLHMEQKLLQYVADDTFKHAKAPTCIDCYSTEHRACGRPSTIL